MFLPQTAHVTRTYGAGHHPAGGHPTTSRKNINKENAFALPSKTPSRINVYKGDAGAAGPSYGGGAGGAPMMLGKPGVTPGPSTRPGLGVKTEARNRNALGDGTGQGGGGGSGGGDKGKGKDVMDLGPKRLFASTTKPSIQPSRSQTFAPLKTPARAPPPASTRTLQNIRTPAPRQQYGFHNQLDVPAATPLPSATRARRKSRQSLNSSGSGSSTKDSVSTPLRPVRDAFQTPGPAQHAWEEEHSLESIEELEATEPEPQPEVLETMQEAVEEVEAEQLEVEYMPPRMEEPPCQLPFDMPDLQEMFSRIASAPPLWTFQDPLPPPTFELDPDLVLDVERPVTTEFRPDDDLEDPLFKPEKAAAAVAPGPSGAARKTVTMARPATQLVRPGAAVAAKPAAMVRPVHPDVQRSTAAPSGPGPRPVTLPPARGTTVARPTASKAAAPSVRRPLARTTPIAPARSASTTTKSSARPTAPGPAASKPKYHMPVFEDAYPLIDELADDTLLPEV